MPEHTKGVFVPYLYQERAEEQVDDLEINELLQKVRKFDDRYLMEKSRRSYALWINIYGGEFDLAEPIKNKSGFVSKEVMLQFLSGMLEVIERYRRPKESKRT